MSYENPQVPHEVNVARGSHVLVSANKANQLVLIDATTHQVVDRETVNSPSGVFGVWRAYKIGL